MKSFNFPVTSDTLACNNYEAEDDIPSWSSVDKNALGTFDSNGVFQLEATTSPPIKTSSFTESASYQTTTEKQNSFFSALEPNFSHSDNFFSIRNWYYCDPSNIIRGPFTSQEMQDWYKAGYFDPFLSVKREDAPGFETLTSLINRVGDAQNPFSAAARIFPENQKASFTENNTSKLNYISDDNLFFPSVANQAAYSQHQLNEENDFLYRKKLPADNYNSFASTWQDNTFPPKNDTFLGFNQITADIHPQPQSQQNLSQQQYLNMLRQNQQQQQMFLQEKLFLEQYHQQQQKLQFLPDFNQRDVAHQQKTEELFSEPAPYLHDLSSNKTEVPKELQFTPVEANVQEKVEDNVNTELSGILSNLRIDQQQGDTVKPQSLQSETTRNVLPSATKQSEKPKSENSSSHTRSNTWSSASLKSTTKLSPGSPVTLTPSQSTNSKQRASNAWNKSPVRQKHMSMTASIPPRQPQPTATPTSPTQKQDVSNKKPSEDFIKWCKLSLRDLNPGVNGDEILQMLLSFPVDNSYSEIIQDIIYANSASLDGRRFANDFMTRRKQDMEGKKLNIALPTTASEFKVVTKKGKKRH